MRNPFTELNLTYNPFYKCIHMKPHIALVSICILLYLKKIILKYSTTYPHTSELDSLAQDVGQGQTVNW